MAGKTHAGWQGPSFPHPPELLRPLLEGQKAKGAIASTMLLLPWAWCRHLHPGEQGSTHGLLSPGPGGQGLAGAGMEAHPALLPSWNSGPVAAVTAVSGPPHSLPRFPLLKICFQQEPAWCQTHGTAELLHRAPATSRGPGSLGGGQWGSPPLASQPLLEPASAPRLCHHRALLKPAAHLCSRDAVPHSLRQPWGLQTLCSTITDEQDPARGRPGPPDALGGKPSDTVKSRKEGDVRWIKIAFCPGQGLNTLEQLARQAHKVDSKTEQGDFGGRCVPVEQSAGEATQTCQCNLLYFKYIFS